MRRFFPAMLVALAGCSASAPSFSGTWTTFQGSPTHNAVLAGAFSHAWTAPLQGRTNGGLALAGGRIFADTFGRTLVALDAADGSVLWRARLDNVAMSTPIVAQGLVVVGTGLEYPGDAQRWARAQGDRVEAFDAASGALSWSFRTRGEDMPSPVYADGAFIFANGDAHAYALRASDGTLLWKAALPGISTMASAVALGDAAFIAVCSDGFLAGETLRLDARSGRVMWTAPQGYCDAAPTLGGKQLYVSWIQGLLQAWGAGGRGMVSALNPQTGKLLWTYRDSQPGIDTEAGSSERAVTGTYVAGTYYQAFPGTDQIVALDARTGRLRWTFRTLAPVKMSVIVYRGRVLFGDAAGVVYALDARTGRLLRANAEKNGFSVSPFVIEGSTLLYANGARIVAQPAAPRPFSANLPIGPWRVPPPRTKH